MQVLDCITCMMRWRNNKKNKRTGESTVYQETTSYSMEKCKVLLGWLFYLLLSSFWLACPPFYSSYVGGLGLGACLCFFCCVNFPSFGMGHYVFWFGFHLLELGLGQLAIGLSSSSPLFMWIFVSLSWFSCTPLLFLHRSHQELSC